MRGGHVLYPNNGLNNCCMFSNNINKPKGPTLRLGLPHSLAPTVLLRSSVPMLCGDQGLAGGCAPRPPARMPSQNFIIISRKRFFF